MEFILYYEKTTFYWDLQIIVANQKKQYVNALIGVVIDLSIA
ncbi:hypothetical protein [Maribacter luteus]|nr:hypothetical protein [Maribacter luteus]